MADAIDKIEGIGKVFAEKLSALGIRTTDDLLARCGAPKARATLATETGISEKLILRWTNMADLMRISGVGGEYAELLEAAGVDTVKELRTRNAANLATAMASANEQKKLTRRVPSETDCTKWIEQAKTLDPKVTY